MNASNCAWIDLAKNLQHRPDNLHAVEALDMMREARIFEIPENFDFNTLPASFTPQAGLEFPFDSVGLTTSDGIIVLKRVSETDFASLVIFPHDLKVASLAHWVPSFSGGGSCLGAPRSHAWLIYEDFSDYLKQKCTEAVISGVELALYVMAMIQSPKQFIVELEPTSKRKKPRKNPEPVARLSERPIYISLTSQKIRERFGLPTGRRVADHDRRAHYRMLRAERFVNKQGQRVFVKAHFAAPAEGVDPQGRHYKVRLDIAASDVPGTERELGSHE